MKLIIVGGKIDERKISELLRKALRLYNINILMYRLPQKRSDIKEFKVDIELYEKVKYSPISSLTLDEDNYRQLSVTGAFLRDPKLKYGVKSNKPHFYHYALAIDSIAYLMETLRSNRLVKEWKLVTPFGVVTDLDWRRKAKVSYDPTLDPAFLKPVDYSIKVVGIKVPLNLDKLGEMVYSLREKIEKGEMKPIDLLRVEKAIYSIHRLGKMLLERGVAEWARKPSLEAWMILNYGGWERNWSRADNKWRSMSEKEREQVERDLENFLKNAKATDKKLERYLELFIDRMNTVIRLKKEELGSPTLSRLEDLDDAQFPLGLAKTLVNKPYVLPELEVEVGRLLHKTRTRKKRMEKYVTQ